MSQLDRRGLLRAGLGIGGAAALSALGRAQGAAAAPGTAIAEPYVVVETAEGRLRGGHSRGALAFKGVAYGGSVAGAARFKAPPPLPSWSGVRDALRPGPPSIQPPGGTYGELEPAYSEDCLTLSLWTPAVGDGRKRPVLFYSHGGGFSTGSGGHVATDGGHLARDHDVVVVSSNHRLGLLGYLYLGDIGGEAYAGGANAGMQDIAAALAWVSRNIAAFGGDPDNLLVFGESGGGGKTCALCAMPSARGRFHKVGVQSGPLPRALSRDRATATARSVLAQLQISPSGLDALASVPTERLLRAQAAVQGRFGPTLDGTVISQHPFDPAPAPWIAGLPLLIGTKRDEARFDVWASKQSDIFKMDEAALVDRVRQQGGDAAVNQLLPAFRQDRPGATPGEIYIALTTAAEFWVGSVQIAQRMAARPGAPVYMYRDDYESNFPIAGTDQTLGASHATDAAATFNNPDYAGLMGTRPDRAAMGLTLSAFWASFARTGQPAAPGQPAWPTYDLARRSTLLIDLACKVEDDPHRGERLACAQFPQMGQPG